MSNKDNDKGKVALAQLARDIRENLHAHIELSQLQAKIARAKYLALIAEGFNEHQALALCKV